MRTSQEHFRTLVERHQRMVFSTALRLLSDPGEAEEVAQDVFLELYDALPKLQGEEHIKYWLKRVATHRAIDAQRRRAHRPERLAAEWSEWSESNEAKQPRHSTPTFANSLSLRLDGILHSLPEPYRTAVTLRYAEDTAPEDIAQRIGQPLATVKSQLQRGLVMMRRKATIALKEWTR